MAATCRRSRIRDETAPRTCCARRISAWIFWQSKLTETTLTKAQKAWMKPYDASRSLSLARRQQYTWFKYGIANKFFLDPAVTYSIQERSLYLRPLKDDTSRRASRPARSKQNPPHVIHELLSVREKIHDSLLISIDLPRYVQCNVQSSRAIIVTLSAL